MKQLIRRLLDWYYYKRGMVSRIPNLAGPHPGPSIPRGNVVSDFKIYYDVPESLFLAKTCV